MKPELLIKINGCKNKKGIDLRKMQIGGQDIKKIMQEILQVQPKIKSIDLDSNGLGDADAIILGDCLRDFHHLETLSIQFNNIGKEGAFAIFSLMKELPDLDILFRNNNISDAGEMMKIKNSAIGKSQPAP